MDGNDSDSGSASGATSKQSLSTLPTEIKARIAELAAWQDASFRARWFGGARGEDLTQAVRTEWHGKSLSSLSLTCREFNQLASTHLFRTISIDQVDSTYFHARIFPRHAHSIRAVKLVNPAANDDQLLRAFATLRLFPHLDEMQIDGITAAKLFGLRTGGDNEDEVILARQVLASFAPRITSLHLSQCGLTGATALMEQFPSLVEIKLALGAPGFVDIVRDKLAAMPRLRKLELAAAELDDSFALAPEWSQGPWRSPLRSIKLIGAATDANAMAFVTLFSETLEHLTLHAPLHGIAPSPPPSSPPPILTNQFPVLSTLVLRNFPVETYELYLKSIVPNDTDTTNPIPISTAPLESIDITLLLRPGPTGRVNRPLLNSSIDALGKLRHLRLVQRNGTPITQLSRYLLKRCQSAGIQLSNDSREDPFVLRATVESVRDPGLIAQYHKRLQARHGALIKSLDFGRRMVDRMLEHEEVEGMETAFKVLGDLHGWQLLEED